MEATIGHWAKRIIYTATILIKLTWATIQAKHTMISATLVTHKIITSYGTNGTYQYPVLNSTRCWASDWKCVIDYDAFKNDVP